MRWFLLFLLSLPLVLAIEPLGCCIPPYGSCFDSSAFPGEQEFQSACEQADGTIAGAGQTLSCTSFTQCRLGCCCAGPDVFDSPTINSNEELLQTTQNACSFKDDYIFQSNDGTCVATCGGTITEPSDDETHTVSGTVFNASDDTPLSDVGVYVRLPDGDLSDITAADGTFRIQNVPRIRTHVFAVHPDCRPGQSASLLVDDDKAGVEIKLTCELQTCVSLAPAFTEPPAVKRGTDEVGFTVALQDNCQNFVQYEPLRCDANGEHCLHLPPTTSDAIVDHVEPETTYCYIVRARFATGAVEDSIQSCVTTGHERCMEDHAPEWCGSFEEQSAILRCDDQNILAPTVCDSWSVCVDRGAFSCERVPDCATCNGLFGLFAKFNFRISPDGVIQRPCDEICRLDKEQNGNVLMCDAYSSCAGISDCSQYKTEDACQANMCNAGQCSWRSLNDELGLGVCVGEKPPCAQCEDILGYCTKDACTAISAACYYDGDQNNLNEARGCLHKDDMACRYYDTEEDCTGGVNAAFDVSYTDGARSGSNARTTTSQDVLGIGACSWVQEKCIKNADNLLTELQEDDCYENNYIFTDPLCLTDSTPPETTFFFSDQPYPRVALRTLPYTATDDQSPADIVRTYVCFGTGCQPDTPLSGVNLPEEGTVTLRYYSIDASENAETVKEHTLQIIDTHEPAIENIDITEVS